MVKLAVDNKTVHNMGERFTCCAKETCKSGQQNGMGGESKHQTGQSSNSGLQTTVAPHPQTNHSHG